MQPLAPSPSRSPHSLCTSPRDQQISIQNIAIATHLRSPVAALRTHGSFTQSPTADRMTQKRTVHAYTHSQPTRPGFTTVSTDFGWIRSGSKRGCRLGEDTCGVAYPVLCLSLLDCRKLRFSMRLEPPARGLPLRVLAISRKFPQTC